MFSLNHNAVLLLGHPDHERRGQVHPAAAAQEAAATTKRTTAATAKGRLSRQQHARRRHPQDGGGDLDLFIDDDLGVDAEDLSAQEVTAATAASADFAVRGQGRIHQSSLFGFKSDLGSISSILT